MEARESLMKPRSFLLLLFLTTIVAAETRPATQDELQEIRVAVGLDDAPTVPPFEVMDIEGTLNVEAGGGQERLFGIVWFRPFLVQGSLCLLPTIHTRSTKTHLGFDLQDSAFGYTYWLSQFPEACAITDKSSIPADAVRSDDVLPSASVAQILRGAEGLLDSALDFAINEQDWESQWEEGSAEPEKQRSKFRRFQSDSTVRLLRVSLNPVPIQDFGFVYNAKFGGHKSIDGPSVSFSATPTGLVLHSVSWWVY